MSKFVGAGPSSYKKRIYRAAVSQRLRNTALEGQTGEAWVPSRKAMLVQKSGSNGWGSIFLLFVIQRVEFQWFCISCTVWTHLFAALISRNKWLR